MKIAYILYSSDWQKRMGVVNKIKNQISIWKLHNDITIICASAKATTFWDDCGVEVRNIVFHNPFQKILWVKDVLELLKEIKPDLVYMRTVSVFPFMNRLLQRYKVVMEINTLVKGEVTLKAKSSFWGFVNQHRVLRGMRYLAKCQGLVAVSNEIKESIIALKVPVCVIPNSIPLSSLTHRKKSIPRDVPRLFFMGSPDQAWHGIDKIVSFAKKTIGKLEFHILGIDKPKDSHEVPNIRYYGYVQPDEFYKYLPEFDIGIGTLALHRKGMDEASSLKVRDYLAFGFPIIIGYQDTALMEARLNPYFILQLPNSENNVEMHIEQIINFAKENQNKVLELDEVSEFIDSKVWENKRLLFFNQIRF